MFATPSFWSGVGRLLGLWGKFDCYNLGESAKETDNRALYSDWRIVGQDIRDSFVSIAEQAELAVDRDKSSACQNGEPEYKDSPKGRA